MTKKDYELIAKVLRESKEFVLKEISKTDEIKTNPRDTIAEFVDTISEGFSIELQKDNQKFDKRKFLKACGSAWAGYDYLVGA